MFFLGAEFSFVAGFSRVKSCSAPKSLVSGQSAALALAVFLLLFGVEFRCF
jgi:hypothetical protein